MSSTLGKHGTIVYEKILSVPLNILSSVNYKLFCLKFMYYAQKQSKNS